MKKRIVYINVVCSGSTGKIMRDTSIEAEKKGYETYCFFGRGNVSKDINALKIGNKLSVLFHVFLGRLGFNGHGSYYSTKKLVKKLKEINPDIIHLHNIHGYYINLKVLFNYLKNDYKGKVIWTLHDCWAFTGHCAHYIAINCSKWQHCCYECPQLKSYPKEYFDTTKSEYKLKKELFTGLENLTITVPSVWLEQEVKKSFLKDYSIKKIYNGISLDVFRPLYDKTIYEKYNIPKDKKILLGVANVWKEKKGLDIFLELAKIIKDDEIIVLVGLNKKQIELLPKNIIGITRTENQEELVKLYSISTVFINPSYEETFSLVTVEAMACGLPVVVCGMSAPRELVSDNVGVVVNNYTAKDYYEAYKTIINKNLKKEDIREYSQKFRKGIMTDSTIKLYEEV